MSLLLDGLDEVAADRREKCVDAINEFRTEHGLTALTVCSRSEEYQVLKAKISLEGAIMIQPLTAKQVDAYFERFGKCLVGLKQALKKDKALQELAETPLMLSILALAYSGKQAEERRTTKKFSESRFLTRISTECSSAGTEGQAQYTQKARRYIK